MKIHTYSDVTSFYPRSQRGRRHSTRNFNFFNFYIYFIIIVIFFSPTYQLILAPLLRRCFFGSFETKKKKRKKSRGERINLASTRENFCHFRQFSSHRLPNEKKKKRKKKQHPASSHTRFFSTALYVLRVGSIGTSVKDISSFSISNCLSFLLLQILRTRVVSLTLESVARRDPLEREKIWNRGRRVIELEFRIFCWYRARGWRNDWTTP